MTLEFQPFPKIARLNRDIVVTEKIDGTNAAIVIVPMSTFEPTDSIIQDNAVALVSDCFVYAQSRTRFITPSIDNYGFAGWVERNAEALVTVLGPGTHFGEWWGAGIQRKYNEKIKRFSLFNTARWAGADLLYNDYPITGLGVVPVLYEGPFSQPEIDMTLADLEIDGSKASPGFMRPEGIVVWHEAARQSFKVTIEGDAAPKGIAAHARDEEIAA